jgi:hypothetical protein
MIYFYKKAHNETTDRLKSIIIVDEAHNVFLKDTPHFIKESVTDLIYREMREFGVGLVCLDQHISKLSETVAGNSATIMAFQQILPADVDIVSSIFQMREEKKFFTMLPVGSAIVRLAERHYTPFTVNVPLIKDTETKVGDQEIKEKMQKKSKFKKRMKVHTEDLDDEALAKKLLRAKVKKVEQIFRASGVEATFTEEDAEKIGLKLGLNKLKKKSKPEKIREGNNTINHLQLDIIQEAKELIGAGFPLQRIRQYFIKRGYRKVDITRALKNVKAKLEAEKIDPQMINIKQLRQYIRKNKFVNLALKKLNKRTYSTSELYKSLKLSARKGNEMKKELLTFGLIKEIEEKAQNGRKKMLDVTELAKRCM